MNDEENVKYIPEMWFETDEDEDIKVAFMTALFNQWNGEGKGFNADMLDSWHLADIQNEINLKTKDKLDPFNIGKTKFSQEAKPPDGVYKIGFDGIQLYNFSIKNLYNSAERQLPWTELAEMDKEDFESFFNANTIDTESKSTSLYDVFNQLFIILNHRINQKLDKEFFDELWGEQETLNEIVRAYKEKGYYQVVEEEGTDGTTIERHLFNADQLNGIRIFLKTRTDYDENTPESIKNNPRNLIFIVEDEDAYDSQGNRIYEFENPDTCPFSEYYRFRVMENTEGKLTLHYQHPTSNVWHDMGVTSSDLIDDNTLFYKIKEILSSNSNYTLNKDVFLNTFKNITVSETDDYPFLDYLKDHYIHGALIDVNSTAGTYTKVGLNNTIVGDNYTYLDLTTPLAALKNGLQNQINTINTTLTDYNTRITNATSVLGTNTTDITSLSSQIANMKGESSSTIKSLEDRIAYLEENTIPKSNLQWKRYHLAFFDQVLLGRGNSYILHNPYLHLVVVHIDSYASHSGSSDFVEYQHKGLVDRAGKKIGNIYTYYNKNENYTIGPDKYVEDDMNEILKSPLIPEELRPPHCMKVLNCVKIGNGTPTILRYDNDGKISIQCPVSSSINEIRILSTIMYRK